VSAGFGETFTNGMLVCVSDHRQEEKNITLPSRRQLYKAPRKRLKKKEKGAIARVEVWN
jgi:hypothetical protein